MSHCGKLGLDAAGKLQGGDYRTYRRIISPEANKIHCTTCSSLVKGYPSSDVLANPPPVSANQALVAKINNPQAQWQVLAVRRFSRTGE